MQLYEILPEQDLSIEKVSDQQSADRFLSRIDKKKASISQPGVLKKLSQLRKEFKALKTEDPKTDDLAAAIERLEQWVVANPIFKAVNPAKFFPGHPGNSDFVGPGFGKKDSAF